MAKARDPRLPDHRRPGEDESEWRALSSYSMPYSPVTHVRHKGVPGVTGSVTGTPAPGWREHPVNIPVTDASALLYHQVTGRGIMNYQLWSHARWRQEYVATGMSWPRENMIAAVTPGTWCALLDSNEPASPEAARVHRWAPHLASALNVLTGAHGRVSGGEQRPRAERYRYRRWLGGHRAMDPPRPALVSCKAP